ncbi:tRNA synthetases class I (M)-domain-containing protein [Aspergillus insuetus]
MAPTRHRSQLYTASARDPGSALAIHKLVLNSKDICTIDLHLLQKPGKRNILIASALLYMNNVPHLGNLIGSLLSADVFARYCKGRGINTLYVCGTDEYGTTPETRALIEGCTPQELCDKYGPLHAAGYNWFNISFDIFGRTTTQLQTEITHDIFLKPYQNGYLKEKQPSSSTEQHSSFLADRFVRGGCPHCDYTGAYGDQCDSCGQLFNALELKNPKCTVDNATPVKRDAKHIFLELDKLQPEIEQFFKQSAQEGAWSSNGKDTTSAWLKKGLEARSITWDIKWGTSVPLPGYENKVVYPWFDACIGYISITANYTDEWRKKDKVAYHTFIFPGGKFSKSRSIGVFGDSAQKAGVASDVWRYYLISHRLESSDTEYNWDAFITVNNNLLLKNLGNFVSRVIKFVNSKNYNSIVPDYTGYHEPAFDEWKATISALLGNIFLQLNGLDNKLAPNEPRKCAAVIGLALNLIHLLGSVIEPFMPDTAKSINAQLRSEPMLIPDYWNADFIKPGHEIGKAAYLFSNVKSAMAQEWRESFGGQEAQKLKEEEAARKAAKKAGLKAGK